MLQKVNNISYLCVRTFDVSACEANTQIAGIVLPQGAEILHISVEVKEAGVSALKADIKINEEVIGNDIDCATKGVHLINFVKTLGNNATTIDLQLNKASNKGELVLRAHYFLPSQIQVEY